MVPTSAYCAQCGRALGTNDNYCPGCGLKLQEKALSVSIRTQLGVYLLSLLLPPLGLWPGFKYLRAADPARRRIGWLAIILTFVAVIATAYFVGDLINRVNEEASREMSNLGF